MRHAQGKLANAVGQRQFQRGARAVRCVGGDAGAQTGPGTGDGPCGQVDHAVGRLIQDVTFELQRKGRVAPAEIDQLGVDEQVLTRCENAVTAAVGQPRRWMVRASG